MEGTAGLQIAAKTVAPLLTRLLLPASRLPAAEYNEPAIRVRRLLSFAREHRTLTEDDLHKLARELVRRAVRAAGPHDPPVVPEQRDAVGQALTRTLHALGDLEMDDVQAVALGPEALAEKLAQAAGAQTRRLLGEDAGRFHDRLLVTACVHILRFFSERPGFGARTDIEVRQEQREIHRKVERVLEQLGRLSREEAEGDAEFEADYAAFVARRQNRLVIHGVDLNDPDDSNWPLESAYLTLDAVPLRSGAEPEDNGDPGDDSDGDGPDTEGGQPLEGAFADHERLLLRGVAGTGKTTLVQWLAYITARQKGEAGRDLAPQLLGRVPFVLPLRTLTGRDARLPSPNGFLGWAGGVMDAPEGWAQRVMKSGRALMLVDGVDEIPKDQRDGVREWLRGLMDAYPGNLWLVTTRPAALERGWLSGESFREYTLNAMRPSDTKRFVERWHVAAGADPESGRDLAEVLRVTPELSRLATNPLMCGLICALNRERRGVLPHDRITLYEAALDMLLRRRDPERKVYTLLNREAATEPLKALAHWLIRNERMQLDRDDAAEIVRRLQLSVPRLKRLGTADEALQFLLERSGLLREPTDGAVAFIHRTFQDFLGAKALLEERDMGMLVNNAHLDEWEDVVQMAVAQGDHMQRADILTGLTDRADQAQEPAVQDRLRLLALASLEVATRLDPEVVQTVRDQASRMVPPRSLRQARGLARTGPLVLNLLPGAAELSGDEELATVHAICQIGGDAAISRLQEFLDTGRPSVRAQLLGHWDRFDTETYATEIIRPLLASTPGGLVTARSSGELAALRGMPGCERVGCHGDFALEDILAALDPGNLRELRLRGTLQLGDLGVLEEFGSLETLVLEGCRNLRDPAPLARLTGLKRLTLRNLPGFEPMSELEECGELDELHLGSDVPWRGLTDLPCTGRLRVLSLPPAATELEGIAAFGALEELRLREASGRLVPDEWGALLAGLPRLRTLSLSPAQLSMLLFAAPRVEIPQVTRLEVRARARSRLDLDMIARRLPGLRELYVSQAAEIDLSQLAGLQELRHIRLEYPGTVHGTNPRPETIELDVYPHL
ncbi:NACHT domain-containing protein [Streptomyces ovatisporus]|uniref:NACHT domain-containing protein n=1 Tax=Streptomyces ovatisporus TaxID=1128682 RepID=A0ABV9A866_9ACTN